MKWQCTVMAAADANHKQIILINLIASTLLLSRKTTRNPTVQLHKQRIACLKLIGRMQQTMQHTRPNVGCYSRPCPVPPHLVACGTLYIYRSGHRLFHTKLSIKLSKPSLFRYQMAHIHTDQYLCCTPLCTCNSCA